MVAHTAPTLTRTQASQHARRQDPRSPATYLKKRWPILAILAFQAALTLRLHNTAFRDEALYIYTGHRIIAHWLHGVILYDHPSSYFSGAPAIYPVFAALLDRLGGLTLVRLFSLGCMLGATVAIGSVAGRWFGSRAGLFASAAFAVAGPTLLLSSFATFDAPALGGLAWATAWLAKSVEEDRWKAAAVGAVSSGLILALCVMIKYACLLFVPFSLLVAAIGAGRQRAKWSIRVVSLALLAAVVVVVPLALTVGHDALQGLAVTTTDRRVLNGEHATALIGWVAKFVGLWLVLAAVALFFGPKRQLILKVVLLMGALAPALYQIGIHEFTSLQKHVDFGLIYAAPLCGLVMARLFVGRLRIAAGAIAACLAVYGVQESGWIFHSWNNTSGLISTMGYALEVEPQAHTLGDVDEPIRYAFENSTQYWQWDSTEYLYYRGLTGLPAYEAGLRDHYWQYVYFDGETDISAALLPQLKAYGYSLMGEVPMHSSYGPTTYYVWRS